MFIQVRLLGNKALINTDNIVKVVPIPDDRERTNIILSDGSHMSFNATIDQLIAVLEKAGCKIVPVELLST